MNEILEFGTEEFYVYKYFGHYRTSYYFNLKIKPINGIDMVRFTYLTYNDGLTEINNYKDILKKNKNLINQVEINIFNILKKCILHENFKLCGHLYENNSYMKLLLLL